MSFFVEAYRRLPTSMRSRIRFKILPYQFQEIHIERVEETYTHLVKWISKHPETMLMPTFSVREPTPEELRLYERLIRAFTNPVGLHVHISDGLYRFPPPPLPSYNLQYEKIKRGLDHLRSLGVQTDHFSSGNWKYNEDTFLACKKLGLVNVHIKNKKIPEITYKHGIPKGIRLIPISRILHDYEV